VISFLPTNNIASGLNIYIRFPDTFDLRLGKDTSISVVQGLTGDIKSKLSARVVTISGFSTYETSSGKAIKVQIDGVINPYMPESGHSGYISVGTISPGSLHLPRLRQPSQPPSRPPLRPPGSHSTSLLTPTRSPGLWLTISSTSPAAPESPNPNMEARLSSTYPETSRSAKAH
jgi:hypothetical protein